VSNGGIEEGEEEKCGVVMGAMEGLWVKRRYVMGWWN